MATHDYQIVSSCNTTQRMLQFSFDIAGEVGGAYYGVKHPMKPHRMRMTNELIVQYGLADHLDVFVSAFRPVIFAVPMHMSAISSLWYDSKLA